VTGAFVVAAAVLVRLALNPEVLRYPLSDTLIFNWLLYGYGVPAAAFIIATRQFGSRADDRLVKLLEAGSVIFSVLLVTLELWHALSERPLRFALDNFELNAMETAAWLAMAAWLLHLGRRRGRAVLSWSGIVLFGCATLFAVGWQAVIISPLTPFLGQPVEGWFLFDSLLLAYGLARFALRPDRGLSARTSGGLAGRASSRRRLCLSVGDTRGPPSFPGCAPVFYRYRGSRS